jgi:hypothetical protein
MELLGDMGLVETNLVHLEIVFAVQDMCMVCAKRTIGSELFWTQPMTLLGDEAQVELILVHLEIVLILTQDSCMVFAEPTISLKIILDASDGTTR